MLDDEKCLCGSGRIYGICCKPFSGMKMKCIIPEAKHSHIGMVIVGCIVSKYMLLICNDRISAVILLKVKNSMYLISANRVIFYILANKISGFCSA